uniref:hypothetical protein n=1 Tax=Paraburkholderia guartelaensis TaxID=2546446 RepID=UPI002AB68453
MFDTVPEHSLAVKDGIEVGKTHRENLSDRVEQIVVICGHHPVERIEFQVLVEGTLVPEFVAASGEVTGVM